MGNSLSCFESGHWDPHPELTAQYVFDRNVPGPLNEPLSHYFISSGHNSYLTSDQLLGAAGTSTIIQCLKRGCRVIELDCYNGGAQGPICKHGGTATKPVLFKDCIVAIKEHGFVASPYPVIITLENHTEGEGQVQLANVLKEVLGSSLHLPSDATSDKWMSPEQLKGKFLIRANAGKAAEDLKRVTYISNVKFKGFAEMNSLTHATSSSIGENKAGMLMKSLGVQLQTLQSVRYTGSGKDSHGGPPALVSVKSSQSLMGSAPVTVTKEGKQVELEVPEDVEDDAVVDARSSFKEAYLYSRTHLLRVYPAGWRINSGNYDPTPAWCMGASFVALNWQQWDKALWVNEAKFRDAGGCGYVRKPEWMLSGGEPPARKPRYLRVHVYSAFKHQNSNCLCGKDDLLVKLDLKGMPSDVAKITTDAVQDSGRLHVDKTFEFAVSHPEMAVLLLLLMDDDVATDDTLGYFSLPVATLREGKYKFDLASPDGKPLSHCWIKAELSWSDEPLPQAASKKQEIANPVSLA